MLLHLPVSLRLDIESESCGTVGFRIRRAPEEHQRSFHEAVHPRRLKFLGQSVLGATLA